MNLLLTNIRIFSHLKIWDLPGVGTPNYPRSCYLEKIHFTRYDFFLILSRTRFTGKMNIVSLIGNHRISFYAYRK